MYSQRIENPIFLADIRDAINRQECCTVKDFLRRIDFIVENTKSFHDTKRRSDCEIIDRVCQLQVCHLSLCFLMSQDSCLTVTYTFPRDLVQSTNDIMERKQLLESNSPEEDSKFPGDQTEPGNHVAMEGSSGLNEESSVDEAVSESSASLELNQARTRVSLDLSVPQVESFAESLARMTEDASLDSFEFIRWAIKKAYSSLEPDQSLSNLFECIDQLILNHFI